MILFDYNAECARTKEVQYFDNNGKMVAFYPFVEFTNWCDKIKFPHLDIADIDAKIDTEWVSLTTEFYHYKNN